MPWSIAGFAKPINKYTFEVQKYTFKVQLYFQSTKVYFQTTKVYTFKLQKYTFRVQRNSQSTKIYFPSAKAHFQSTKVYFQSTKSYFQSAKVYFQNTKAYFQSTKVYFQSIKVYFRKYKSILSKAQQYTFEVQKFSFKVHKYTGYVFLNYKRTLAKFKQITKVYFIALQSTKVYGKLSKYKVTFGTVGTESPESGTFLIPLVPRTWFPVPGTVPGTAPACPEHIEIYKHRWYPQQQGGSHLSSGHELPPCLCPCCIDSQCNLKQALWQSTKA